MLDSYKREFVSLKIIQFIVKSIYLCRRLMGLGHRLSWVKTINTDRILNLVLVVKGDRMAKVTV